MEKNAITIIVPCYNVEKCVEKAINSLLKQTYKNLQIIAIDDCSTDNTHFVLKQLQNQNKSKIEIYNNKENMGLAYTRNRGIELATTQYVGFLDADDYIDNNYYEELMKNIIQENADIAISDILLVNEGGMPINAIQPGINTRSKRYKRSSIRYRFICICL